VVSAPRRRFISPAHIEIVPAIHTALLRQQSVLLAEHFNDPPAYIRSLHHLLDFYADRVKRPGQSGQPGPLIKAYQVHPPVLRQISQELVPHARKDPDKGFALCDALWKEDHLEFRILASMLLGQMPVENAEVTIERIERWLTSEPGMHLSDEILAHSLITIRRERPNLLVDLIQSWLNNSNAYYKQLGLRALLPLTKDDNFENFPAFFSMIQPLTENTPKTLRPDLLEVLANLAHRSPQETAYFLHDCLKSPGSTDVPWLIRKIVDQFPPDLQESLRQSIRRP
jgi:DNA alkylation repair enzyme